MATAGTRREEADYVCPRCEQRIAAELVERVIPDRGGSRRVILPPGGVMCENLAEHPDHILEMYREPMQHGKGRLR